MISEAEDTYLDRKSEKSERPKEAINDFDPILIINGLNVALAQFIMRELKIPPAALKDKDSFEILRVWAAFEEQHVTIHSGINGDAGDFGFLLAELALHASKLYAEKFDVNEFDMLKEILDGFNKEIINESGNPSGGIED